MKLFADTRPKRNTALMVLMVWLFALASSVANACFLESDEPHSRAEEKVEASTSLAPTEILAQQSGAAGHHDDSDGTKESCLKVCDDLTHTLPKAYSGGDYGDPGPAPLVVTLLTAWPHVVTVLHRLGDVQIPIVGLPLRVRYARLAL